MNDWFFKQGGRHRLINWLGLDAWLDSAISEIWERTKNRYSALSSFFARFRLTGWRRLSNELASEAATLGAGGLIVLYALALPAFVEIEEGRWQAMNQISVKFTDSNGNELGQRGINLNDAVPLDEIPDHMIKAALATEDRRFFEHFGIDVIGTFRAVVENLRANDVVQGGSSITQQVAKNLFLSPERSMTRKIKEAILSLWLESRLTKREILKLYLDRAYMGGGAFGVEAASQFYFGKSVRDISLAEAALLAGLFKAPSAYAPHVNLPASRARTSTVLSALVESGYYTAGEVHAARLNPAQVVERRTTDSPDWYLDWAFEEIQRIMRGKGHFVLTARTTVDLTLQKQAEEALLSTVSSGRGQRTNPNAGAIVAMETDGAVRALVGGTDYGESQFNRATHARRQPGSSFKTYVFAAALQDEYTMNTMVRDSSVSCGRWSPKNYNGSHGSGARVTLANAFKRSLNTVAVYLSLKVKRQTVVELTQELGIKGIRPSCSMALGDMGITPLEHTGGFATFANGGKLAKPYGILEVFTSKGELVYSRERDEPAPKQIFSTNVVHQMNRMMQLVVTEGTGRRATLDFTHAVGKTGTSSSYRDAWFVGFSGKYVTGVWLGNDDYRPIFRDGRGMTGGSHPAIAWQAFMSVAHKSMDIPTIPGLQPHPTQVAERQRSAEYGKQPGAAAQAVTTGSGIMPKTTRDMLADLAKSLRNASKPEKSPLPAKQGRTINGNEKSWRTGPVDQRDTQWTGQSPRRIAGGASDGAPEY